MSDSFDSLTKTCRKLSIIDYSVDMSVGVYDEEKLKTQNVMFTVDVWVPMTDAALYWDYTAIVKAIDEIVASGHIGLQEEVQEMLFQKLFADQRVKAVRILTKKTQALTRAAAAAVETFRFNPEFHA